jgi:hypothetical protein
MDAMESTLTGPVLYLLVAWGAVTAIFIGLLIWRSLLTSHEDDQIFLDSASEHMAREQRELVAKIGSLTKPIMATGVIAAILLAPAAGIWLWEGLKSF